MLNSVFRSPSKCFVGSLFIALSLGITAAFSSRQSQSTHRVEIATASVFSNPTARRSTNVEIAPKNSNLSEAESLPLPEIDSPQFFPSVPVQEKQFNPVSSDLEPALATLTIHLCNGTPGHAHFWSGESKIGIISQGTVVQLTGKESGEWIEAIALYWPEGRAIQERGQFWINRCWL